MMKGLSGLNKGLAKGLHHGLGKGLFQGTNVGLNPRTRNYTQKARIVIDHTKCGSVDSASFPFLFSITLPQLANVANGGKVFNTNGYDILFYSDAAMSVVIPWEIETYNSTTGQCIFWIQVPNVSVSVDTIIYMKYGIPSITTFQSTATSVWDSNFKGVWHFPNGTTLTDPSPDSTTNGLNGTLSGATKPTVATGQIDGGATANGTTAYMEMGSKSISSATVTVSGWFKRPWTTAAYAVVLHWNFGAASGIQFFVSAGATSSDWVAKDVVVVGNGYNSGVSPRAIASPGALADNTWHYIVAIIGASVAQIYVDGTAVSMRVSTTGTVSNIVSQTLRLLGNTANGNYFDGTADEMRISTTARSASWITTEYNNQNSPSTFFSIQIIM